MGKEIVTTPMNDIHNAFNSPTPKQEEVNTSARDIVNILKKDMQKTIEFSLYRMKTDEEETKYSEPLQPIKIVTTSLNSEKSYPDSPALNQALTITDLKLDFSLMAGV